MKRLIFKSSKVCMQRAAKNDDFVRKQEEASSDLDTGGSRRPPRFREVETRCFQRQHDCKKAYFDEGCLHDTDHGKRILPAIYRL
jgi:hypothetical protein